MSENPFAEIRDLLSSMMTKDTATTSTIEEAGGEMDQLAAQLKETKAKILEEEAVQWTPTPAPTPAAQKVTLPAAVSTTTKVTAEKEVTYRAISVAENAVLMAARDALYSQIAVLADAMYADIAHRDRYLLTGYMGKALLELDRINDMLAISKVEEVV